MTDPTTRFAEVPSFSSPDGRVWQRDIDHHCMPMTRFLRDDFARSFRAGTEIAFERLGAPLARGEGCIIDGWYFYRLVPAGAPDKPGAGPPPDPLLKVVSRLHPELRRRNKIARAAVDTQAWMDDVADWWRERPEWEQRFRARQGVDLPALSDAGLARALEEARDDAVAILIRHFALIAPGAGVGLAAVAAAEHGIEPAATAEALRGCSEATSAPVRALTAIRACLDPATIAAATTLEDLRAASAEAREHIDAYLDTYGWRVLGDDAAEPTLAERPDLLVRSIKAGAGPATTGDPIADVLADIPASDRNRVEQLLRRAGECYEAMDDNSGVTCWGIGLLRRIALESADRLVERKLLARPELIWMLEADEVAALLRGESGPSTEEVERRHDLHLAQSAIEPPIFVGGDPGEPPDPSLLPSGLRAITAAVGTYLGLRFPPADAEADTGRVTIGGTTVATGHGIGSGVVTGRAVVVESAIDALDRLEPGDVLVTTCTNPAYNAVFPIAGAVVTAVGGPMAHAAVTAREIGIPAVVGIGGLDVITDGTEITVAVG